MRPRFLAVLCVVLFVIFALPAAAGKIYSIDPASIPSSSAEVFLTISGAELARVVSFEGPAGSFKIEAQLTDSTTRLVVWVPLEVINTPGIYDVTVWGNDGSPSNAAKFEVRPPDPGSLLLLVPDPIAVEATSRSGAVVTFDVWPYGGRDPNPVVKCSPASGSLFPRGKTDVLCTADNSFGEHAEGGVSIFVYDGKAPVISVPDRIVAIADDQESAAVKYEVKAFDDIDGDLPVSCSPESGSRFKIGVTVVDCVAWDSSLNPGYGSFEVEVKRAGNTTGELHIRVPEDMNVEATGPDGAEVKFDVTATDTADPNPIITCNPRSGSTFPLGRTLVQCDATDRFGNHDVGDFYIGVSDTTKPVLELKDIDAEASGDGAEVVFSPVAHDIVDGDIVAYCDPHSGSRFPTGTTQVQCTATDNHGNTASGSFFVRVSDSGSPIITSMSTDPSALEPNHKLAHVRVTIEAVDGDDPMPSCSVMYVTSNDDVKPPSGGGEYDWNITGPSAVELRGESTTSHDRIYTIHVTCTDRSGNSASGSVDVTVPKSSASDSATTVTTPGRRRGVKP